MKMKVVPDNTEEYKQVNIHHGKDDFQLSFKPSKTLETNQLPEEASFGAHQQSGMTDELDQSSKDRQIRFSNFYENVYQSNHKSNQLSWNENDDKLANFGNSSNVLNNNMEVIWEESNNSQIAH